MCDSLALVKYIKQIIAIAKQIDLNNLGIQKYIELNRIGVKRIQTENLRLGPLFLSLLDKGIVK